jgi:GT2 family glycosyltransferase
MTDKVFVAKTIESKPFYMSPVEIIIPFHNEQAKVISLINDIFITVQKNRYLITLVDDGSVNKDFTKELEKKKIPGLRFLNHDDCKGFGASVNTALKNPFSNQIPFVAILHSDVRIRDQNWLFNLGQTLSSLKQTGVKMISSLTDNPVVENEFLKASHGEKKKDHVLTDGFLPMYCVLSHRDLFNRVGFLKEYPYAGGEVEDFAQRMKKMGFKQGVCGSSWVQHEGRGTLSQFAKNKKVQEILRNVENERNKEYKNGS